MSHEQNKQWKVKTVIIAAIPAVLLLAPGCENIDDPVDEGVSGDKAVAPESTVTEEAAIDSTRMGKRRHHGSRDMMGHHKMGRHHKRHCPLEKLLKTALEVLDLTDEQRATLEGLRDSEKDGKKAGREDHFDFHEALIKALDTGKLDRAAFEAKIASKEGMIEKKLETRNAKLASLHATLTPEQRKTLVEAVRAKIEAKMEKHGDQADVERKGRKHKHGFKGKSMLMGWLRGIELTAEQQAQVDALVAKAEAQRPTRGDWAEKREAKITELKALLDAFATDDFDPAESAPTPKPMKNPADKMAFHIDQIETLLGILTAEQRAQLAEQIKSHPGKMRHGKMGMGGPGCKGGCAGDCKCAGNCDCAGDCPFADDDQ